MKYYQISSNFLVKNGKNYYLCLWIRFWLFRRQKWVTVFGHNLIILLVVRCRMHRSNEKPICFLSKCMITCVLRDHSSITSSKRWVGGVRKWQFLMIYSTVNHQKGGWVGLKKSKTWWRNTWMVPKINGHICYSFSNLEVLLCLENSVI